MQKLVKKTGKSKPSTKHMLTKLGIYRNSFLLSKTGLRTFQALKARHKVNHQARNKSKHLTRNYVFKMTRCK